MNKILSKVCLALAIMSASTMATEASTVTVNDFTIEPSKTVVVPVGVNNDFSFCGFQCDIALPEGFDIEKNKKGRYAFGLTDRADDHTVSSRFTEEGVYRMVVVSFTNTNFEGNSGALVDVPVVANADVAPGEYTMKISNFRLSDALGYEEKMAEVTCKITVTTNVGAAGIEGDDIKVLAHDGNITIVGAKVGEMVAVYDITGRMIGNAVATEAETVTLAIGVNGVYVVRIGNDIRRVVALK